MQDFNSRSKESKRKRKKKVSRSERIEIRCTPKERKKLEDKAADIELSLSEFIRRASLGMRINAKSRQVNQLIYELNRIGTNLNQLTRLAHLDRLSAVDRKRLEGIFRAVEAKLDEVCGY